MLFHNSAPSEKFAMRSHLFWAFASFCQLVFNVAGMGAVFPLTDAPGYFGWIFLAIFINCFVLAILGLGGIIFHFFGYLDHKENLQRINGRE